MPRRLLPGRNPRPLSTRQPRSRALLSFLAVLFLILGSLIWITPGPARAADAGDTSATADTSTASDTSPAADAASSPRAVVQCSQDPNDLTCPEALLTQRISEAGTTPTRIILGATDTMLTQTLKIPAGADIELVNGARAPWGTTTSGLNREDGFTGTMVQVPAGAALTFDNYDGGTFHLLSRGEWVPGGGTLLDVRGSLTINGGEFSGVRGAKQTYQGAITVSGKDASFTLNGGKVTDNHRELANPGAVQYGAANIAVTEGATFVMNGGEVSKGKARVIDSQGYGEVGGIGLYKGGNVTINGGTITENSGFAGGMVAFTWLWSKSDATPENSARTRGYITVNGGTISRNRASFSGGGILAFGNADITMNAGTIDSNNAPNGGGVGTFNLYTWGADGTWQEIPGDGMNWGFTREQWTELSPGGFTMNGGTISNNSSWRTGGGVNVVSNKVLLNGGTISGNRAGQQGGGVYVATANYTLHLADTLVTENAASGIGGGIWTCPTGNVEVHVDNGAAVFGNTAKRYGADLAHDNLGSVSSAPVWLSDSIIGGGLVDYYQDNEGARFDPASLTLPADQRPYPQLVKGRRISNEGFAAAVSDPAKNAARGAARLVITGNAAPRGAGIGTNGSVIFGTWGRAQATVTKQWFYETTTPPAGNAPSPVPARPSDIASSSVSMRLVSDTSTELLNPQVVHEFSVTAGEEWTKSFTDLPIRNDTGEFYVYAVQELDGTGKVLKTKVLEPSQLLVQRGEELPARPKLAEGMAPPEVWFLGKVANEVPVPVDITVTKQWAYRDSNDPVPGAAQPEQVEFELLRDTSAEFTHPEVVQTFTVTKADNWTRTLTGLPRANAEGVAYVYGLREKEAGAGGAGAGDAGGAASPNAMAIVPVPAGPGTPEAPGTDGIIHRAVTVVNTLTPPPPTTPPTVPPTTEPPTPPTTPPVPPTTEPPVPPTTPPAPPTTPPTTPPVPPTPSEPPTPPTVPPSTPPVTPPASTPPATPPSTPPGNPPRIVRTGSDARTGAALAGSALLAGLGILAWRRIRTDR
ncbi:Cna B-type domain-containing protein [Actinotignum sp. GS-2025e]|uniref:Cna B-type domain-containing protein n=1 Tax=unclassified Actinotignum TaxID=2632702 RepID=UPI003F487C7F